MVRRSAKADIGRTCKAHRLAVSRPWSRHNQCIFRHGFVLISCKSIVPICFTALNSELTSLIVEIAIAEALGDLDLQLFSLETNALTLAERKVQLTAAYKETSELRQFLQRLASVWKQQLQAGSVDHEERLNSLKYLDNKAREYSANLLGLKDTLKKTGAQPSLYHATLQQLHDQLEQIEADNNDKRTQLEGFKQVPPDASLATLKIEEASAYLVQLEEQIARQVNQLRLHSDV